MKAIEPFAWQWARVDIRLYVLMHANDADPR